jgi:hypothetical protein
VSEVILIKPDPNKTEIIELNDDYNLDVMKWKLSKRSRNLIIIRGLIIFFLCIYMPIEIIFHKNFNFFEDQLIFNKLDSVLSIQPYEVVVVSDALIYIFCDKDMVMIYILLIYITYHPFIGIKLIFVTHIVQFFIVIMRCTYRSSSPMWRKYNGFTLLCKATYSNPSMHFFFITFIYLYSILCVYLVNKQKINFGPIRRIFIIISLGLFYSSFGLLFIIKRLNYLYQLNYSLTISIVIMVVCLDLENILHNYIYKSLKNVFVIRKRKIFIFLAILSLNVFAVLIYNVIDNELIDLISNKEISRLPCTEFEKNNFGLKETFNEITFSYGLLGAFWGTSLTVEKGCGQWWDTNKFNKVKKIIITLILVGLYLYIFSNYIYNISKI